MRPWFFVVGLCLLGLMVSPIHAADTSTPLGKGIYWYNHRSQGGGDTVAGVGPINRAIESLEQALERDGADSTAALFLLKSYYFKGTFVELSTDARQQVLEKGRKLGERMTRRYPTSVPLTFWYAVNLGRWAEEYGILAAAREGVAGKLRDIANEIIKSDPDYRGGAGYSLLGQVHYKTPYIPFFLSWPSDAEAITLFEKALDIEPNIPLTYLYYARSLHDQGHDTRSIEVLKTLTTLKPRDDHVIEDRWAIFQGRDLLRQWS